jgi:hypothetical protein
MRREFIDLRTEINDDEGGFVINYALFMSTIVGVATLYILLLFCIDIAIRSVKLGFLEMIAPIPILSYIDPKSSKDKGMFHQWYKMCVSTYLSLFLRLFALFMGIYVITMIAGNGYRDMITGEIVRGSRILEVFMILGILIFAKQLPKIIEDIFGVKMDGKFTLNPLKRLTEDAVGGKMLLGAGAAGLAGAAAFGSGLASGKGIGGKLTNAFGGAARAGSKGLVGAAKGEKFGKNFSNSYGAAIKANQDKADRKELGISSGDIRSQKARQALGMSTQDQEYESQIKRYEEAIKAGSAVKKRAEGEVDKKAGAIRSSVGDGAGGFHSLGTLRDRVDVLKNTDANTYAGGEMALAKAISEASSDYHGERKKAVNNYISSSAGGATNVIGTTGANVFAGSHDKIAEQSFRQMDEANTKYGLGATVNPSNIGATLDTLETAQNEIQSSDSYRKAQVVAQQTKRQGK